MVMDYCKLNRQTVKNNYPLPLITDLVDNMGGKRVFTKMDLRWGYNNVRIKERDEWKAAFTIHVGSFEPVVMFFGMTNSLAMFQAVMNEILRDLINEGKVAAFVNNVLVGTEDEEGHDEIVDEVLRQLEENNLYVKPEKCVEDEEGTILRSSNGRREGRNGGRKGSRSAEVANTTVYQRH